MKESGQETASQVAKMLGIEGIGESSGKSLQTQAVENLSASGTDALGQNSVDFVEQMKKKPSFENQEGLNIVDLILNGYNSAPNMGIDFWMNSEFEENKDRLTPEQQQIIRKLCKITTFFSGIIQCRLKQLEEFCKCNQQSNTQRINDAMRSAYNEAMTAFQSETAAREAAVSILEQEEKSFREMIKSYNSVRREQMRGNFRIARSISAAQIRNKKRQHAADEKNKNLKARQYNEAQRLKAMSS